MMPLVVAVLFAVIVAALAIIGAAKGWEFIGWRIW